MREVENIGFLANRIIEEAETINDLVADGDYQEALGISSDIVHFAKQLHRRISRLSKRAGYDDYY